MPELSVQESEAPAAHHPQRLLTAAEFQLLANVPPEHEWFANIRNPRTRKAYRIDVNDFMQFLGIRRPEEFRQVTRAHVIAWRKVLETRPILDKEGNIRRSGLSTSTIRRKLSAVASLYSYLTENNAVQLNPTHGVERPDVENANEGKTPAIGDSQARALMAAPSGTTTKATRDRAILSVFLFHGLRREELCGLRIGDIQERHGVQHFRVKGKGGKVRYIPIHPGTAGLIKSYLESAGHRDEIEGPLFRPVRNHTTKTLAKHLHPQSVHRDIVLKYARAAGITTPGFCTHALRATAATNALQHDADIARVQAWLGHANIATTRLYDKRGNKPEDSPTYCVDYSKTTQQACPL